VLRTVIVLAQQRAVLLKMFDSTEQHKPDPFDLFSKKRVFYAEFAGATGVIKTEIITQIVMQVETKAAGEPACCRTTEHVVAAGRRAPRAVVCLLETTWPEKAFFFWASCFVLAKRVVECRSRVSRTGHERVVRVCTPQRMLWHFRSRD